MFIWDHRIGNKAYNQRVECRKRHPFEIDKILLFVYLSFPNGIQQCESEGAVDQFFWSTENSSFTKKKSIWHFICRKNPMRSLEIEVVEFRSKWLKKIMVNFQLFFMISRIKDRNVKISIICYFSNQMPICDASNSSRLVHITLQFERFRLKN